MLAEGALPLHHSVVAGDDEYRFTGDVVHQPVHNGNCLVCHDPHQSDVKFQLRAESQASYDHEHQFDSLSFTVDEALDRERLHELFESLPKSLLRAKGVLNLAEEPERPTIYQRVGARWSYTTAEPWGKKPPQSSIVLIGPAKSLDQGAIQACLEACRTSGDRASDPADPRNH